MPGEDAKERPTIDFEEGLILVYDKDELDAWTSLLHELLEYRLCSLLNTCRRLVNKLIEFVEAEVYAQKEHVLNQIINDAKVLNSLSEALGPTDQKTKKNDEKDPRTSRF